MWYKYLFIKKYKTKVTNTCCLLHRATTADTGVTGSSRDSTWVSQKLKNKIINNTYHSIHLIKLDGIIRVIISVIKRHMAITSEAWTCVMWLEKNFQEILVMGQC